MLKAERGAGGLADPLPYHFPHHYHDTSVSGQSILAMLGNCSPVLLWGYIAIKICDVDAKVSVLDVNEPTYTPHFMPLRVREGV